MCNFPPKQRSQGVTLAPIPDTCATVTATGSWFTAGPAGRALRGPHCANCWHPSFQLPQWPTSWGQQGKCSLGGQADRSMGPVPHCPKITVCFSFSLLTFFFFFIIFHFFKKTKTKNFCGPSIVTPTTPQGERCLESSFLTIFLSSPNIFFKVI